MLKSEKVVTLEDCAKEPIQMPGLIQAHGYLLVANSDFIITHYSENIKIFLNRKEILRVHLNDIFCEKLVMDVLDFFETQHQKYFFIESSLEEREVSLLIHKSSNSFIFEIYPNDIEIRKPTEILSSVNSILATISDATSTKDLFLSISFEFRKFLMVDRVMVYQFDNDWNGQVIAEDKRYDLESFLGLNYPASDIPEQARKLYERNWLRLIPDVNYSPVNIFPDCGPSSSNPLDLSDCTLRAISPIHIQYLKNMGVQATLVMSIIVEGKLWGLIACHHYSYLKVQQNIRYLCEMFAKVLSANLQRILLLQRSLSAVENLEKLSKIKLNISKNWNFHHSLISTNPNITDLIPCDGAVIVYNNEISAIGHVPDNNNIFLLLEWLNTKNEDVFITDRLVMDYPVELKGSNIAGIASVRLGMLPYDYIIWFRKERIHHVKWAGNPEKSLVINHETNRLSPRGSFAEFKQVVKNRSLPWEDDDKWIIEKLRSYVLEFIALEKVRLETLVNEKTSQLATALKASEEAKVLIEENLALKSNLISSLSHEIRTPLNGILGMAYAIQQSTQDQDINTYVDLIKKSSNRLLATLNSILELAQIEANQKRIKEDVCNVGKLLEEAVHVLNPLSEAKKLRLHFLQSSDNFLCKGDSNLLAQVFYNLISNAIKYTNKGEVIIEIKNRNLNKIEYVSITIKDTGIGMSQDFQKKLFTPFTQESTGHGRKFEGVGLGLSITKKYLDLMGGLIFVESIKNEGTIFELLLPSTN